jgi:hypothetical protein
MMKFPLLSLSLFSLSAFLPLVPSLTPSANACAIVDATTQVAIHGSRNPAQQKNDVIMSHDDNCFNNNIISTTTQLGISPGEVQQTHEGNYFVGGGNLNDTGFTTPVIQVPVGTQVDVYSPAHDPEFLNNSLPQ